VRPLHHPAIEDITIEGIFHALSDPVRFAIYLDIAASDCSQTCSDFLKVNKRSIPKSTLSQHFKILRESGLIRAERRGVEMHNISRCIEINKRFPGLLPAILTAYAVQRATKAPRPRPARRPSRSPAKATTNR
jgi:DNA-binding transcriptional ArsR family regulator